MNITIRTLASAARRLRTPLIVAACAVILLAHSSTEAAAATMYDRFKDIYEVPDKVDELKSQYWEKQQELEAQTEELNRRTEEMRSQTEKYVAETQALSQRNAALTEQNETLSAQLADMTKRQEARTALTRRVAYSVAVVLGMGLLYMLTIRLWRYSVWRRQRSDGWRS